MDVFSFALNIDQLIVVLFLAVTLVIGIISGLKVKTVQDYTVGEKGSFSASVIAMTLIATMIGGTSTTGHIAEIFKNGYIFYLRIFGEILGLVLLARFVASKFDDRFRGMLSSADIIGKFYGIKAEKFTGIMGTIFGVGLVGVQIIALSSIVANFLDINYKIAVLTSGGILIAYSAVGGIRSVAITDVVQFVLLAVGIPIIANLCFQEIGGFSNLISDLPSSHTSIVQNESFGDYVILFLFYALPFSVLYPSLVQRYLMADNSKQITRITYLYTFLKFALSLTLLYIALVAVKIFPDIEPNSIIPHTISNLLPNGLKGMAIAGMIAVIMSTADSFLNTSGILMTLNTVFPTDISDQKKLWLMKLNTILIGVGAIFIALQEVAIFHVMLIINILLSTTTIPLFMKIIGLDVRKEQFWTNVIFGVIAFIVAKFYCGFDIKICLFITAISSILAFIITHLIQNGGYFKYDDQEKRKKYTLFGIFKEYLPSFDKLAKYSVAKVKDVGPPYQLFGIFTCVNYVVPYFMWSFDQFHNQEHLTILRFAAGGLCIFLMLANQWHRKVEKYLPLYWHFTLMFCLPFLTTVMFFCTQAQHGWLLNMGLAVFFLSVLVDWKTFIALNIIGIILGGVYYKSFIETPTVVLDAQTIYMMVYTFIFSAFIGMLFAKKRGILAHEKADVMRSFTDVMAHELKTPISNCKMSVETLMNILQSGRSKKQNGKITIALSNSDYAMLKELQERLKVDINRETQLIEMSLMTSKAAVIADDKDEYSMKETVKSAIEEMPLLTEDRKRLSVDIKDDFTYYGSKQYMIHVIWNLLGNAFKHGLVSKPDARITVTVFDRQLWVRDTGKGIDNKLLNKIFDRFYTTSSSTGLGLSFCKMVVEDCGGTISCHSTPGEHTTFVIQFRRN